jgi:CRISPR type IV-associated protein Csf3
MKPLRIDFELETPIRAPAYPVHFDGVLAWAAVQDGLENGIPMEEAQNALPLAQDGEGADAVWKASWIRFAPGPRDSMVFTRPFRVQDVVLDNGRAYHERRAEKWDAEISSSAFKAYLITVPLRYSKFASAWCVGDKDGIERLLKEHVTHLGKLSRLDLGRIRSFSVNDDQDASRLWAWRTMSRQMDGYARAFETVRAPYWKRENRREAWVPMSFSEKSGKEPDKNAG